MPAVLALRLISPLVAFRIRPGVEEKAPPDAPVMVGEGLVPVLQKGVPLYVKAALGLGLISSVTAVRKALSQLVVVDLEAA
ncbi:hypothetical protein BEN47_14265 [Hymenobacter lapidarius]|uniref:Uncharacterized protein n=1 Tax=Hymenobacter lapidarius TaxID=1908237 RepID=A0A1G1T4T0_9BACT|nr:hypothetical protein BEN47_14265 [Hymenobacter lapidarius]